MSNAVYPNAIRGLAWPVMKSAAFDTLVQSSASKVELRIAQTRNPVWTFTLIYNYLKDRPYDLVPSLNGYTDYAFLQDFYNSRQGRFDDFLFDDVSRDFVGPGVLRNGAPNLQAQLQLVNDGAGNYYSPIQYSYAGGFYEDVTDINPLVAGGSTTSGQGLSIFANAALQRGYPGFQDYTIGGPGLAIPGYSFMGLYAKWAAQPTPPITAQFYFYYRVRFDMDAADFEEFMNQLWTSGGPDTRNGAGYLKLISSRTANV